MKPYIGHIINAPTLILLSGWWYFDTNEKMSYLPILIGVMLLSITNGVKYEGKAVTRVAFLFTIIGLIILCSNPLKQSLLSNDPVFYGRIWLMIATSIFSVLIFSTHFIKNVIKK